MAISARGTASKSPDLNAVDLGFFNSLQTLQHRDSCLTVVDLISAVERAYESMDQGTLDRVFLTLQFVMLCILVAKGSNNYALPH